MGLSSLFFTLELEKIARRYEAIVTDWGGDLVPSDPQAASPSSVAATFSHDVER